MYRQLGNLKNVIHREARNNLPMQKVFNVIGNEETLLYLESVLKAFRQNKLNKNNLYDNYQIMWLMELFGYGLSQSFSKYESINEIIQIYYSWLTAFKITPRPNLPPPVLKDINFLAFKILDQLYFTFLPRVIDTSPENLGYQAAACIQILLIITNLTEDSNGNNTCLSHEIWEHILVLLLQINDTLLNAIPDSEGQEYITLGNLVGNHCTKTLFEVWIRSGIKYFPSPPFWKTLEDMCGSIWKYRYLPVIEQWNRCNYFLSELLILKMQNGLCEDDSSIVDNKELYTLLPLSTPLHVVAQYWFRMLHVLGAPQDLLFQCLQKFTQQTLSSDVKEINASDGVKKVANRKPLNQPQKRIAEKAMATAPGSVAGNVNTTSPQLNALALGQLQLCSVLFFRYITGIAKLVDFYLGFIRKDPMPIDISGSPLQESTSPPLPPLRKKPLTKVPQQSFNNTGGNNVIFEKLSASTAANQNVSSYTCQRKRKSEEFFALTIYDYDSVWKDSKDFNQTLPLERPSSLLFKCSLNTLLALFSDWLFASASLNTISYPFAWIQSFNFGKAEACGTLCRIMCKHTKEQNILPSYLFKFYLTIYSALTLSSNNPSKVEDQREINVIQASILCNSYDLFSVDLDGVSLLLPQFLNIIASIFTSPAQPTKQTLNDQENVTTISPKNTSALVLRNAAIRILASVACLPTHSPDTPIQSLQQLTPPHPIESPLTYGQLRSVVIESIFNAIQSETDPGNTRFLLALLCVVIQDFAAYQIDVNRLNKESHFTNGECPNKLHENGEPINPSNPTTTNSFKLKGVSLNLSRASVPHSVYDEACGPTKQSPKPEHWCFDCLFKMVMELVLKTFDRWQNQDYTIAHLCLAALSHLAKVKMLIYKPLCEYIIRSLSGYVVKMCSYAPIKHTKDVHTLIVALYNCLTVWLTYHSPMLDDCEILFLLLEITTLGMTGQKSSQADSGVTYKEAKECRPVSKRVANASECLLNVILVLTRNSNRHQVTANFTFQQELSLLIQQPNIKCQYYSCGTNYIMGLYEMPYITDHNEMSCLQRLLVIHNQYGRYVWDVTYEKATSFEKLNTTPKFTTAKKSCASKSFDQATICDTENKSFPNTSPNVKRDTYPKCMSTEPETSLDLREISVFPDHSTAQAFHQMFNDALAFENILIKPTPTKGTPEESPSCTPFGCLKPGNLQRLIYSLPKFVTEVDIPKLFGSQLRFSECESLITSCSEGEIKRNFGEDLRELVAIKTVPLDVTMLCYVEKNCNSLCEIFKYRDCECSDADKSYAEFISLLKSFDDVAETCQNDDGDNISTSRTINDFQVLHNVTPPSTKDNLFDNYDAATVIQLRDNYWKIKFVFNPLPKNCRPDESENQSSEGRTQLKRYLTSAYATQFSHVPNDRPISPIAVNTGVSSSTASPHHSRASYYYTDTAKRKSSLSLISTLSTDDGNVSLTSSLSGTQAQQQSEEKMKKHIAPTHHSGSYRSQSKSDVSQGKILFVLAWLELYQDKTTFPLSAIYDIFNEPSPSCLDMKIEIFVIFIHPLTNGLYKFATRSTLSGKNNTSFPIMDGLVVSKATIIPLLKETIIHNSLMKRFENENYQMPEHIRKCKIQSVISKFKNIQHTV